MSQAGNDRAMSDAWRPTPLHQTKRKGPYKVDGRQIATAAELNVGVGGENETKRPRVGGRLGAPHRGNLVQVLV